MKKKGTQPQNIVLPNTPEEVLMNIIQDLAKVQVLMNELVIRYNGLVNLLIDKNVITESELQEKLSQELQKMREALKELANKIEVPDGGSGNIIVPESSIDDKEN